MTTKRSCDWCGDPIEGDTGFLVYPEDEIYMHTACWKYVKTIPTEEKS